ncbi:alpha-amylase [Sulfurimonas sp.]|nr:alpha-amylase [Sulfurimonas sp.]
MSNNNHKANQGNVNEGTSGTNKDYQKVLDNRSNQLNPQHPEYKSTKGK